MKTENNLDLELKAHIIETINERFNDDDTDFNELHNIAFNEDYYIIGYYQASQWLESHDIDPFDAIDEVITYEQDNFGSVHTKINSESIVNMYAYIKGEEIIHGLDIDLDNTTKSELIEALS